MPTTPSLPTTALLADGKIVTANARSYTVPALWIAGIFVASIALHRIIFWVLERTFNRPRTQRTARLIQVVRRPFAFVFPLVGIVSTVPVVLPETQNLLRIEHLLGIAIMAALTWAIIAVISESASFVVANMSGQDEIHRRAVATRVLILSRTFSIVVGLLVMGAALISFPSVRAVGSALVASAGIAGIAAGFAARPVLENLVAGVQLAFTQPIRIDDEVIVEGDYGRIERITATYVVIRTWDRRRMVVPLTYFFDHPFQNWSIQSSNMIGSVLLWVDFSVPVAKIRAEVDRLVANNPLWDREIAGVQVTDASEKSMQVRILVTARTPSETFDLRCAVREGVLTYLQENFDGGLPRDRFSITSVGGFGPQSTVLDNRASALSTDEDKSALPSSGQPHVD